MDYSQRHPIKHILRHVIRIILIFLAVAVLLGVFLSFALSRIPFEHEKRMGDRLFADMSHSREARYLQRYADDVARLMGLDGQITVHYLDEDNYNAYAFLGGHIFVYRPLYEDIFGKHEIITMLLAHEIAHVKHRHVAKNTGRLVVYLMSAMVSGNALLDLGEASYSRSQERDADISAVDVLYKIYGRVDGAYQLMELLGQDGSGGGLLSTHPDIQKRIKYIREYAEKYLE